MKTSFGVALLLLAALVCAPTGWAQTAAVPQGKAFRCIYDARQGTQFIRYSGGPIQTSAAVASVNDAWNNYIHATYHVNDSKRRGGCQMLNGIAANRAREVSSYEQNSNRAGVKTVHVNWTSAPGQVAAAPVHTPAPAHAVTASASTPARAPSPEPTRVPTVNATPTPAPQPSALAQYPEASQLAEPFRTRALNEVSNTKRYCRNNPIASGMFDCDCFASMVLRQRIAHASEYRVTQNPNDTGGWDPLENLFYSDRLPCTECISDARLTKYATDEARNSMINAITNHSIPAAGVKSVEDCTATKLVTDFRAKPFMGLAQGTLNTAITTCWKQYWQ